MTEPLTVAFCNQKGGVSKTTLAVHCAQRWAECLPPGTVHLIDRDSQQNASWFLEAMPQVLAEDASTVRVRVIDTPPTLGPELLSTLQEARFVIVPVNAFGAVQGLAALEETVERVRGRNPFIETLYALTMQHPSARSAALLAGALRSRNGPQVLAATIRRSDAFEVAWIKRTTVFTDAPQSSAAQQMRALCDELFERLRLGER